MTLGILCFFLYFFFQAEDGIRDRLVTGVQTCALPIFDPKAPKPDLVIFLQASTEVLLERVSKRGRDYEAFMDPDYLDSVNKAFNNFFFYYSNTPLLVINTNEIDFVEKKCDLEELINKINSHRIGREYYNPLGS